KAALRNPECIDELVESADVGPGAPRPVIMEARPACRWPREGDLVVPSRTEHLRLVWPEWQGAGSSSVRALAPEFPFDIARRGYTVGTKALQAVLPEHDGPTAFIPVDLDDAGLEERDGVEAKTAVLRQLDAALAIIREHDPARITTLGGDCGVSMAPF